MGTIHRSSDCNEKSTEKVLNITGYFMFVPPNLL
jgi:hypothetical protein